MTESALEREIREQRRWRLRPHASQLDIFLQLLAGEFSSAREQRERADARLRHLIGFAAVHVPYYRRLFRRLNLTAGSIATVGDLPRLPILTRAGVQENAPELRAERLPRGEAPGGLFKTSGTTGQPVTVHHTLFSRNMFHYLKQREFRWWRVDPMQKLAWIRPANDLPLVDNAKLADGVTAELAFWPPVGTFFFTGPFAGFNNTNSIEARMAWLDRHRPAYLLSLAADLEHLALAYRQCAAPDSLRSVQSVSQQLTPAMRKLVEDNCGVPVHENYGLNEIGIIASRCPESGWFHVHAEHCLVEVVDEQGNPLPAGRRGRLIITGLSNPAMPLIRYDVDDLAEIVDEACPCGRTLPSLRNLRGRYRRVAHLPEGTWAYWNRVVGFLNNIDPQLSVPLRQYQLHQQSDGGFVLRLKVAGPLGGAFLDSLHEAWREVGGDSPASLTVLQLDEIPQRGLKFQNFISDLAPSDDRDYTT